MKITDEDIRNAVIRKIRALLSKTAEAGCTEDEVMSAAAIAAELMARYQIEMSDTERDAEGFVFTAIYPRAKWQFCVYQWIATSTARFCGAVAFEKKDDDGIAHVSFYGKQSDADFADWLLRALADFVILGLEEYELKERFGKKMTQAALRLLRNGYLLGACNRLVRRLQEMTVSTQEAVAALGSARALVSLDRQLIAKRKLKQDEGISLGSARSGSRAVDDDSKAAGKARADRASFGRPVGSHGGPTALISKE